jgi:hypothetical protein
MTTKALDLVRKKEALDSFRRAAKIREAYFVHVSKEQPRLEHVYRDRSWKATVSMDLKVKG